MLTARATIEPMPVIEGYEFGRVTIDGREETRDVIVLPHRVVRDWWRKDGHGLVIEDLDDVLAELPGATAGRYRRPRTDATRPGHARDAADPRYRRRGRPTPEAVARYAELDPQTTAAALHLTC